MGFIRTKKIKGYEYAYLVHNRWRAKKGPRQKVKAYLGKVYRFDKQENKGEFNLSKGADELIKDLVLFELFNLGFEEDGDLLRLNEITYNKRINSLYILQKKIRKKCVIGINEGFLCTETIRPLFNLKSEIERLNLEDDRLVGLKLAEFFVEAGLKVPEDVFVDIYEKLFGSTIEL